MSHTHDAEFFTTLSQIVDSADSDSVEAAVKDITSRYGLKSAAYFGIGLTGKSSEAPHLAVTYSSEWVEHYKEQRFVEIDPVIQTGFRRLLPLDWSRIDKSDCESACNFDPLDGRIGVQF